MQLWHYITEAVLFGLVSLLVGLSGRWIWDRMRSHSR